eukprot:XP_014045430.1 PREDICTED: 30S ribosomal protein S16-like [Salmo salar]
MEAEDQYQSQLDIKSHQVSALELEWERLSLDEEVQEKRTPVCATPRLRSSPAAQLPVCTAPRPRSSPSAQLPGRAAPRPHSSPAAQLPGRTAPWPHSSPSAQLPGRTAPRLHSSLALSGNTRWKIFNHSHFMCSFFYRTLQSHNSLNLI